MVWLLLGCGAAPARPPASRWVVIADQDVPLEGARRVEPEAPPPDPLARAAERLAEARQLAMRFESEDALAAASEAQEILEEHVHDDRARAQLHLALSLRGLLESNLERPIASREALERAARLDPEATLDEALFPPDLRETYAELVGEVRAEPPASLGITTEPAGARVTFDGRDVGEAPASVHARAGAHFVGVRALAHDRRVLPVRLAPEGNAPLTVRLPPASAAATAAQLASVEDEALLELGPATRSAIGERLDADVLLRVRDGSLVALALGEERQLSGRLERPLSSWVDELFYREPDAASQVFGSGWFWVAVSVVVLGAAAAITAAVLYEPEGRIRAGAPMD